MKFISKVRRGLVQEFRDAGYECFDYSGQVIVYSISDVSKYVVIDMKNDEGCLDVTYVAKSGDYTVAYMRFYSIIESTLFIVTRSVLALVFR